MSTALKNAESLVFGMNKVMGKGDLDDSTALLTAINRSQAVAEYSMDGLLILSLIHI